jgi:hypothetical protein
MAARRCWELGVLEVLLNATCAVSGRLAVLQRAVQWSPLRRSCVCLYAWNSSRIVEQVFMKFDMGELLIAFVDTFSCGCSWAVVADTLHNTWCISVHTSQSWAIVADTSHNTWFISVHTLQSWAIVADTLHNTWCISVHTSQSWATVADTLHNTWCISVHTSQSWAIVADTLHNTWCISVHTSQLHGLSADIALKVRVRLYVVVLVFLYLFISCLFVDIFSC